MAKGRQRQKNDSAPRPDRDVPQGTGRMKHAYGLFDSGDKVRARREAKEILASSPTEDEAREANDLLERTRIPREAFIFAIVAAIFIAGLITIAILRT